MRIDVFLVENSVIFQCHSLVFSGCKLNLPTNCLIFMVNVGKCTSSYPKKGSQGLIDTGEMG